MSASEQVRRFENNCPFIFANETLYQLSYTPRFTYENRFQQNREFLPLSTDFKVEN